MLSNLLYCAFGAWDIVIGDKVQQLCRKKVRTLCKSFAAEKEEIWSVVSRMSQNRFFFADAYVESRNRWTKSTANELTNYRLGRKKIPQTAKTFRKSSLFALASSKIFGQTSLLRSLTFISRERMLRGTTAINLAICFVTARRKDTRRAYEYMSIHGKKLGRERNHDLGVFILSFSL